MATSHYELRFFEEVENEVRLIPEHVLCSVSKYLSDLKSKGLKVGMKLEHRFGRDLSMCYKIYMDDARYRIVYKSNDEDPAVIDIIAIQRKTDATYNEVQERISKRK